MGPKKKPKLDPKQQKLSFMFGPSSDSEKTTSDNAESAVINLDPDKPAKTKPKVRKYNPELY